MWRNLLAVGTVLLTACAHGQGGKVQPIGDDDPLKPIQPVSVDGRVVSVHRVDPSAPAVSYLGQCVDEETLAPSSDPCLDENKREDLAIENIKRKPFEGGTIDFYTARHKNAGEVGAKAWGGLVGAGGGTDSGTITWLLVRRRFFNEPVHIEPGFSKPLIRQVSLGSAVTVALSANLSHSSAYVKGGTSLIGLRAALDKQSLDVNVTCREIGANACQVLGVPRVISSSKELDDLQNLLRKAPLDDPENAAVVGYLVEWPEEEAGDNEENENESGQQSSPSKPSQDQ